MNVGSIFLVHNIISPILSKLKININKLLFIKIASFSLGMGAMITAYYGRDIMKLIVYALSIFNPLIVVPFICALIGMKGDSKSFFIPAISGLTIFICSKIILKKLDLAHIDFFNIKFYSFYNVTFIKKQKIFIH